MNPFKFLPVAACNARTVKRVAILGLVLLAQAATLTFADPADSRKVRLAVIDLSTGDGITAEEGKMLTVFIRDAIVNSGRFEVMDRQRVADILKEQNFSAAFSNETTQLVKVGKLLDANRIVGGRVGRFGKNWSLVLSLVDVNLGTLISSYAVPDAGSKENLLNSAPRAGLALVAAGPTSASINVRTPSGNEEQIRRFTEKMKEVNPDFDGVVQHKLKDGAIVELTCSSASVIDLSPIRAFRQLEVLRLLKSVNKSGRTLVDLSPLKGIRLWCLEFQGTHVSDLSPLRGMPLRILRCSENPIKDISPLKGMPLGELHIAQSQVSDLSPLRGSPLTKLVCHLSRVTDLSALTNFRLKLLRCDYVPARDNRILREIRTLEQINGLPAAEFWKRVEAGEAPQYLEKRD